MSILCIMYCGCNQGVGISLFPINVCVIANKNVYLHLQLIICLTLKRKDIIFAFRGK